MAIPGFCRCCGEQLTDDPFMNGGGKRRDCRCVRVEKSLESLHKKIDAMLERTDPGQEYYRELKAKGLVD